jgi:sn-glycerol 3-phosphate transport system ATP-binding protein
MRREIRALQQELGITMVYVTHDQTEAMSMADQVVLLNAGRVEQAGAPEALYARPATPFAARFIGTPPMNLITLERLYERTVIRGTHGPAIDNVPAGCRLLGLRPEHLWFDDAGVPAEIESVEYFGADSIAMCRVGENLVAVRAPGHLQFERGARAGLAWNFGHQHFFPALP